MGNSTSSSHKRKGSSLEQLSRHSSFGGSNLNEGERKALLAKFKAAESQGRLPLRAKSFLKKELENHQDFAPVKDKRRRSFGTFRPSWKRNPNEVKYPNDEQPPEENSTSDYLEQLEADVTRLQAKCASLESQAILATVQQLDIVVRGLAIFFSLATLYLYWKLLVMLRVAPWILEQLPIVVSSASSLLGPDVLEPSSGFMTALQAIASNAWANLCLQLGLLSIPYYYDKWTHGSTHRRFEVFALAFLILGRIRMCRWRERIFLQEEGAAPTISETGVPSKVPRYGESCTNDGIWDANYEINARLLYLSISRLRGLWTKVAQYISSRADFMPVAYIRELSKLQDQTTATPWGVVEKLIPKTLLQELSEIDETPIASASIGQVHLARLVSNNQRVVVKVQHPHARTLMTDDFWSLKVLCRIIAWMEPEYIFMEILMNEWAVEARKELDFNFEANHLDTANKALESLHPTETSLVYTNPPKTDMEGMEISDASSEPFQVEVPKPIRRLSNRNVLVMNFCEGCKIDNFAQMEAWGLPREAVMDGVAQAFAHFMYCSPIFNGDPHSGNLLVRKGTKADPDRGFTIVVLDWGLAKELPESKRIAFCQMVHAAATLDYGLLLDSYKTIGLKMKREDSGQNMEDMRYFLRDIAPREAARKSMKSKMKQREASSKKTQEKVPMESKAYPGEFFFFIRVTELLQGLGSRFSINLGYIDALAPYAEKGLRMSSFYDLSQPSSNVPKSISPSVNPSLEALIRGVMAELKEEGKLAGGQVCIIDKTGQTQVRVSAGDLGGLRSHIQMKDDTVILGYSTTKAIAATLAHLMVQEGYLDYDEPVCERVWPEFCPTVDCPADLAEILGIERKEAEQRWKWKRQVTLRHILNHSAGFGPALPQKLTIRKMASCEACVSSFEYNPELPEETLLPTSSPTNGGQPYHFMSFGWLVAGTLCGAFARKHDDKPNVTFEEVYETVLVPRLSKRTVESGFRPMGGSGGHTVAHTATSDISASKMFQRRRRLEMENGAPLDNGGEMAKMMSTFEGKEFLLDPRIWNSQDALNANVPSAGGRFSAEGLASFYHDLYSGKILKSEVLNEIATEGAVETSSNALQGITQISSDNSGNHTKISLGYQLIRTDRDGLEAFSGVGHSGVGGSIGFFHRPTGLSIAIMLNKADAEQAVTFRILRTIGDSFKI